MASIVTNKAKALLANGTLDWVNDTIRVALLKTAGAASPDADFVADAIDGTNNVEVTTAGYARQDLATRTVTEDDTGDVATLDAADNTWTAVGDGTESAVMAVVYKRVGVDDTTPADDPVLAFVDFADTVLNGGDFTVRWSASGVISIS